MFERLYEFAVESIAGKAKTKIYRTFVIWLVILHVDLIYFALFVDQALVYEATKQIKSEYIANHFLNISSSTFWILEGLKLLIAIGFSAASVWLWPRTITLRAYKQEIENEEKLKIAKIRSEHKIAQATKRLTDEKLEIVEAQNDIREKEEQIVNTEEEAWQADYKAFKKVAAFKHFQDIVEAFFQNDGHTQRHDDYGNVIWEVDTNVLAYCVSNDVIELKDRKISLTKKGKFFVKQFQSELHEIPF